MSYPILTWTLWEVAKLRTHTIVNSWNLSVSFLWKQRNFQCSNQPTVGCSHLNTLLHPAGWMYADCPKLSFFYPFLTHVEQIPKFNRFIIKSWHVSNLTSFDVFWIEAVYISLIHTPHTFSIRLRLRLGRTAQYFNIVQDITYRICIYEWMCMQFKQICNVHMLKIQITLVLIRNQNIIQCFLRYFCSTSWSPPKQTLPAASLAMPSRACDIEASWNERSQEPAGLDTFTTFFSQQLLHIKIHSFEFPKSYGPVVKILLPTTCISSFPIGDVAFS